MKIYFACSISGGRQDEKVYQQIVKLLDELGVEVPTAHIAETGIEQVDSHVDANEIYQRDVDWIRESDLLIAEVSTPSHGVGYEIGYALSHHKPVLCLHNQRAVVSKMITGNPDSLLSVTSYQDWPEAESVLRDFVLPHQSSRRGENQE